MSYDTNTPHIGATVFILFQLLHMVCVWIKSFCHLPVCQWPSIPVVLDWGKCFMDFPQFPIIPAKNVCRISSNRFYYCLVCSIEMLLTWPIFFIVIRLSAMEHNKRVGISHQRYHNIDFEMMKNSNFSQKEKKKGKWVRTETLWPLVWQILCNMLLIANALNMCTFMYFYDLFYVDGGCTMRFMAIGRHVKSQEGFHESLISSIRFFVVFITDIFPVVNHERWHCAHSWNHEYLKILS